VIIATIFPLELFNAVTKKGRMLNVTSSGWQAQNLWRVTAESTRKGTVIRQVKIFNAISFVTLSHIPIRSYHWRRWEGGGPSQPSVALGFLKKSKLKKKMEIHQILVCLLKIKFI
jgi:hypothetical protein